MPFSSLQRKPFKKKLSKDRIQRLRQLCNQISAPPKEGTRRWYVKRLDSLAAQIVKTRDGHRCVQCGDTFIIDCGHIYSRSLEATRFDLENCHAQCRRCNTRHISRPEFYLTWFQDNHGEDALIALHARAYSGHRFSIEDLQQMVSDYEAELERVRADALMEVA